MKKQGKEKHKNNQKASRSNQNERKQMREKAKKHGN